MYIKRQNKVFVYSGIEPGKKGAGKFVSFFLNIFHEYKIDITLVSYNTPDGLFVKLIKKLGFLKFFKNSYYLIIQTFFRQKVEDSKVVIFHPQSIGLNIVSELISNNKSIYIYVLDNFIFCRSSYNYLKGNDACVLCLKNKNSGKQNNCDFFPNNQKESDYHSFINSIENNLLKITFLCQNENQAKLVKAKFGGNIKILNIGMLIDLEVKKQNNIESKVYDFVYHNTNSKAKGILYFLELAKKMNQYNFMIPYSKSEVIKEVENHIRLDNVHFIPMNWDTGLREIVINAKIVVNPSLWSAPVEGALLKSIQYNGCVAVVPVIYSFQEEIPADVLIHLNPNIDSSVNILCNIIESKEKRLSYIKNSKLWLENYKGLTESSISSLVFNEFIER